MAAKIEEVVKEYVADIESRVSHLPTEPQLHDVLSCAKKATPGTLTHWWMVNDYNMTTGLFLRRHHVDEDGTLRTISLHVERDQSGKFEFHAYVDSGGR